MITIRKSDERGKSTLGWLKSYHTFSFADYYDPKHVHFSNLRVINEDTVEAGYGFDRHPHNNMEIISYVIEGALSHEDSMGTGSTIRPGEIQRMSAGTGITHSEYNASNEQSLHFLQIWIVPETMQLQPSYEQITIDRKPNKFILIGSPATRDDAITIHQQVDLYAAYLDKDVTVSHAMRAKHGCWLQLIKGEITLNGKQLKGGDGAAITDEKEIEIHTTQAAELLLFDLKLSH